MRFEMIAKSVLVRPQGLRPRARAPLAPLTTSLYIVVGLITGVCDFFRSRSGARVSFF